MRKQLLTHIAAISLFALAAEVAAQPQWPEAAQEAKAGSRWWWLGSAVDEPNLTWNMEQYAQAGFGSLEITPIYGVKGNTPNNVAFLSPSWLGLLKYTESEGGRLGMDIDMTTGTGWPFGGPMVKTEESASKLVTEEATVTGDGQTPQTVTLATTGATLQRVMAFPTKGNDGTVTDLTAMVSGKKVEWTAPAGQWRVIAVYCQPGIMQVKRAQPGSEGLVVDHFDREAVANYLQYFETRFEAAGKPYPHSFFNDSYEITQADWTRNMFQQFEHYRGYKLEENMDKLLDRDPQVLADYRQTLSDMLLNNFTRQWTDWAHRHGATTRNQAHGSPGNLIDLYAAADIPETESFYLTDFGIQGLRQDPGFTMKALSSLATLKYASSAAHITGKPLVSSESMTWLTEHFRSSLSQMKPELDLLFTAGVNHVMFHGTAYSPSQAAWPGWKFYAAVDMSPTNSIWRDAPEMLKYIERTQSFLQMGQPENDLLVYAPFANAMHKTTGSFQQRQLLFDINTLDTKMADLAKCVTAINQAGMDCDYTSEQYLMQTQYVGGQLQTAADTRYRALLVPVSENLPDSIRAHLDALAAQGANIVYGYDDAALAATAVQGEELRTKLGLSVIRRCNATGHHYFIANLTPDDAEGYVTLAVPFASAVLFDPLTGDIADAPVSGGQVFVSLKSGQSVILQTYDTQTTAGTVRPVTTETGSIVISDDWQLSFTDDTYPNMQGQSYKFDSPQTWEGLDEKTAQLMGTGIYEATFRVTAQQMQTATGGFSIDLGDVRESARVYINNMYIGTAWSVPFVLDCKNAVKEGENTLRIEVTNLPANRIRQMDIDGTQWRIFEDINMSNISTATYNDWALVPSGLNAPVKLLLKTRATDALTAKLTAMLPDTSPTTVDNSPTTTYYPAYLIAAANGATISTLTATDLYGQPFIGITSELNTNGTATLTITAASESDIVITARDADGHEYTTLLPTYGPYVLSTTADLTAAEAPGGGWMLLKNPGEIKGFSGTGKQEWYRSTLNGLSVTLYDGIIFNSSRSNYYFFFPGYGMNANNPFEAEIVAQLGDIAQLSYLVGEGASVYVAADSLLLYAQCGAADDAITLNMPANTDGYIYRSLSIFHPLSTITPPPSSIKEIINFKLQTSNFKIYDLNGRQRPRPGKGLNISPANGSATRKVILK